MCRVSPAPADSPAVEFKQGSSILSMAGTAASAEGLTQHGGFQPTHRGRWQATSATRHLHIASSTPGSLSALPETSTESGQRKRLITSGAELTAKNVISKWPPFLTAYPVSISNPYS